MLGYITLGTNDLPRAAAFYDQLFAAVGAKRFMETDRFVAWSTGPTSGGFGIGKPFDGKPATAGNGTMIAIVVDSKDKVNAIHKKALALGGKDEGAPGPREMPGFYVGYFRDLDGNKLNVFCMGA